MKEEKDCLEPDKPSKLVSALLLPINPSAVILLGIYTIVWGVWVANPYWDVFSHKELYGVMSIIAPEVFWGILAIVVGIITTYGAVKRSYGSLVRGAAVSGWHWMMISIFNFIGDPLDTGGITALIFAVYSAFIYLNIKVNFCDDPESKDLMR